ncbi:hypothetical protein PVAP13_2NG459906, partial [Panicum virgatum]
SSTCTSPGCRSSSAGSAPARGDQRRGGGGNGVGGGGGKRGKGRGPQQAGQATQAGGTPQPMGQRPIGPWFCFNPGWAAFQQQAAGGWRGSAPGLLGPSPQAHTAFAPLQVSPPAQSWDQAGLIAALN